MSPEMTRRHVRLVLLVLRHVLGLTDRLYSWTFLQLLGFAFQVDGTWPGEYQCMTLTDPLSQNVVSTELLLAV